MFINCAFCSINPILGLNIRVIFKRVNALAVVLSSYWLRAANVNQSWKAKTNRQSYKNQKNKLINHKPFITLAKRNDKKMQNKRDKQDFQIHPRPQTQSLFTKEVEVKFIHVDAEGTTIITIF